MRDTAAAAMRISELTFPALVEQHASQRGDALALSFEGRYTTYAQLDQQSTLLARALRREDIKAGTRVGYLAKNSDRFFELLIAVAKMGGVLVPIGWRLA